MLTIFKREDDNDLYRRYEESHYQKVYELNQLVELLDATGFDVLDVFGKRIGERVQKEDERIYIVAKVKERR